MLHNILQDIFNSKPFRKLFENEIMIVYYEGFNDGQKLWFEATSPDECTKNFPTPEEAKEEYLKQLAWYRDQEIM